MKKEKPQESCLSRGFVQTGKRPAGNAPKSTAQSGQGSIALPGHPDMGQKRNKTQLSCRIANRSRKKRSRFPSQARKRMFRITSGMSMVPVRHNGPRRATAPGTASCGDDRPKN